MKLYGQDFASRLLIGTALYPSPAIMEAALKASGAGIVTVSLRRESAGGHFRAESQTEDGEALRHDDEFSYVAAWEYGAVPTLYREQLNFEYVHPSTRSYK